MELNQEREHVYQTVAAKFLPLRGTPKQVQWAQDIRADWLRRQVTERITWEDGRFVYSSPAWIDGTRKEHEGGRDSLIRHLLRSHGMRERRAAMLIDARPRRQA